MPSRALTLAVLVFWLGTTTWVFFREAWPWMQAGQPPPHVFDLTDEVGASRTNWIIVAKGEEIGNASSSIHRRPNRIFELRSEYFFKKGNLAPLELKKIVSVYELDTDGDLRSLAFQLKVILPKPLLMEAQGDVTGEVENGLLKLDLKLKLNDQPQDVSSYFKPTPIPAPRRMLNPMHLVHRYPGLREGQTWKEPLFNFMAAVLPMKVIDEFLLAKVTAETLPWNGQDTDCHKISYFDVHQKATAITWVRRADSVVLQQEAHHGGLDLILKRVPTK